MQNLWEIQPQGLVLVLHPGQVQLCNCNFSKVAGSTNWIFEGDGDLVTTFGVNNILIYMCSFLVQGGRLDTGSCPSVVDDCPSVVIIKMLRFSMDPTL